MATFNLFGDLKKIFRELFGNNARGTDIPEAAMLEAEEVLFDIFDKFLADIAGAEPDSALLDTTLSTSRGRTSARGRSVPKIEIEVEGYLYNWMDNGVDASFSAGDYTVTAPGSPRIGQELKAFPILVRDRATTDPKSLEVKTVPAKEGTPAAYPSAGSPNRKVGDPVIFRRGVRIKIKAREWSQTIAKEAQEELERRGVTGIVIEAIDG